ncbi:hypothetical protein CYMTET_33020 [Cymbomonas tetramitiformis]|uniref:CRAL-TRIO domain-containing protein n=1 Tax=Cymbomonas tetramitiformis TaxID=36881 RepID=A0AAE0FEI3_9CHLO|nr:hypothetical protein CYMTET_33020 [Cymbomonas tetramitiformis]
MRQSIHGGLPGECGLLVLSEAALLDAGTLMQCPLLSRLWWSTLCPGHAAGGGTTAQAPRVQIPQPFESGQGRSLVFHNPLFAPRPWHSQPPAWPGQMRAELQCASHRMVWSSMYGNSVAEDWRHDIYDSILTILRLRIARDDMNVSIGQLAGGLRDDAQMVPPKLKRAGSYFKSACDSLEPQLSGSGFMYTDQNKKAILLPTCPYYLHERRDKEFKITEVPSPWNESIQIMPPEIDNDLRPASRSYGNNCGETGAWLQDKDTVVFFTGGVFDGFVPYIAVPTLANPKDEYELTRSDSFTTAEKGIFTSKVLKDPKARLSVLKDGRWIGFRSEIAQGLLLRARDSPLQLHLSTQPLDASTRFVLVEKAPAVRQQYGLCESMRVDLYCFSISKRPLSVVIVRLPRPAELKKAWASLLVEEADLSAALVRGAGLATAEAKRRLPQKLLDFLWGPKPQRPVAVTAAEEHPPRRILRRSKGQPWRSPNSGTAFPATTSSAAIPAAAATFVFGASSCERVPSSLPLPSAKKLATREPVADVVMTKEVVSSVSRQNDRRGNAPGMALHSTSATEDEGDVRIIPEPIGSMIASAVAVPMLGDVVATQEEVAVCEPDLRDLVVSPLSGVAPSGARAVTQAVEAAAAEALAVAAAEAAANAAEAAADLAEAAEVAVERLVSASAEADRAEEYAKEAALDAQQASAKADVAVTAASERESLGGATSASAAAAQDRSPWTGGPGLTTFSTLGESSEAGANCEGFLFSGPSSEMMVATPIYSPQIPPSHPHLPITRAVIPRAVVVRDEEFFERDLGASGAFPGREAPTGPQAAKVSPIGCSPELAQEAGEGPMSTTTEAETRHPLPAPCVHPLIQEGFAAGLTARPSVPAAPAGIALTTVDVDVEAQSAHAGLQQSLDGDSEFAISEMSPTAAWLAGWKASHADGATAGGETPSASAVPRRGGLPADLPECLASGTGAGSSAAAPSSPDTAALESRMLPADPGSPPAIKASVAGRLLPAPGPSLADKAPSAVRVLGCTESRLSPSPVARRSPLAPRTPSDGASCADFSSAHGMTPVGKVNLILAKIRERISPTRDTENTAPERQNVAAATEPASPMRMQFLEGDARCATPPARGAAPLPVQMAPAREVVSPPAPVTVHVTSVANPLFDGVITSPALAAPEILAPKRATPATLPPSSPIAIPPERATAEMMIQAGGITLSAAGTPPTPTQLASLGGQLSQACCDNLAVSPCRVEVSPDFLPEARRELWCTAEPSPPRHSPLPNDPVQGDLFSLRTQSDLLASPCRVVQWLTLAEEGDSRIPEVRSAERSGVSLGQAASCGDNESPAVAASCGDNESPAVAAPASLQADASRPPSEPMSAGSPAGSSTSSNRVMEMVAKFSGQAASPRCSPLASGVHEATREMNRRRSFSTETRPSDDPAEPASSMPSPLLPNPGAPEGSEACRDAPACGSRMEEKDKGNAGALGRAAVGRGEERWAGLSECPTEAGPQKQQRAEHSSGDLTFMPTPMREPVPAALIAGAHDGSPGSSGGDGSTLSPCTTGTLSGLDAEMVADELNVQTAEGGQLSLVRQRTAMFAARIASSTTQTPPGDASSPPTRHVGSGAQSSQIRSPSSVLPQKTLKNIFRMDGRDRLQRPIVLLDLSRGIPSMDEAVRVQAYLQHRLRPLVCRDYVCVMLFGESPPAQAGTRMVRWCMNVYHQLPRPFKKNVQLIVLVNPNSMAMTACALIKPFTSQKAKGKLVMVPSLEHLEEATRGAITVQDLGFQPDEITEHVSVS